MTCRCNRDQDDVHLCHYAMYTCPNSATERLYAKPIGTFSLAGAQLKLVVNQTFACDEHWAAYTQELWGPPQGNRFFCFTCDMWGLDDGGFHCQEYCDGIHNMIED